MLIYYQPNKLFLVKNNIRKALYLGIFCGFIALVLSCEDDFTDIGSGVVTNTKFDTDAIEIEVIAENSPVTRVQSDNISRALGQYLLGVYDNPGYEKLEASFITQLALPAVTPSITNTTYGADTIIVTKIDTAFIKIPYQSTLIERTADGPDFKLDSIFGDDTKAFTLNVFRSNTFINQFNPSDPTKTNSFFSDDTFEKAESLSSEPNYQIIPNKNDTIIAISRRLFDDSIYTTDTITVTIPSTSGDLPVPFIRIPLDKERIKQLFLDKYDDPEFSSQTNFNNYIRGLILEATGNEGSLLSLNFTSTNSNLLPSLEIYYTNTVLESGTTVIDTIQKNDSFRFSGYAINHFKMDEQTYPVNNQIRLQGTAGSEAKLQILTSNNINDLRAANWLINDATLTFYIDQTTDTTRIPDRLFLYKEFVNGSSTIKSQVKDASSEISFGGIRGQLQRDEDGRKESYTFKITDYISDIVTGQITSNPPLKLKVFNPSDLPFSDSDTIFREYSWNPKAVTLLNGSTNNGAKRAVLKISYSEKK